MKLLLNTIKKQIFNEMIAIQKDSKNDRKMLEQTYKI